jgi:hypothetical protein
MEATDNMNIGELLDEIRGQNKVVLKTVREMSKNMSRLTRMDKDIKDLRLDVNITKIAITDITVLQRDYERRITRLESTYK